MIKNYFTVALRHLDKYRFYTIINIAGLTIGIAACLIIFLFVRFELSFDRFHENANRIYRVDWKLFFGETLTYNAAITPPMAEAIVRDFPEVEAAARFRFMGSFQFRRDVENIVESRAVYADNEIFRIFTLPFVAGNPVNALSQPHSMVITESCAVRFFPNEDPLGKTLVKDNSILYTITGVIKDMPENSHFRYNMFLSMEGLDESKNGNWIGGPFNTYLLLRPDANPELLESKLTSIVDTYVMPHASSVLGSAFIDEFQRNEKNQLSLLLRPLTNIHLHSRLRNELDSNGDMKYVYVFSIVAIFILAIACVNFMNLATARSVKRAREVGVRKVMGSTRSNLTLQFLTESSLISLFSFLLAIALTELSLPFFNALTGLHLHIPYSSPFIVVGFVMVAILVGIAAGLYPGFVLSAFNPSEVLKGKPPRHDSSSFFQNGLVVFQFTISIFLTIATLAVFSQIRYMKNVSLGFQKEQIIRMADLQNAGTAVYAFKDEMLRNPMIKNATISSYFPGPGSARQTPLIWRYGSTPLPANSVNIEKWAVDHDYISTLGMTILMGRDFSRDFKSDSLAVIINEAALSQLQLGDDPVGQKLSLLEQNEDGSQEAEDVKTYTIIGIVKDFNFESLKQGVMPLGLFLGNSTSSIAFSYDAKATEEVIAALRTSWKKIAPGEPFNYVFMDENFQRMFNSEKKLSQIFMLFTGLAIFVACMGLFALTAFTAEQRTKEIGIRKVMGASVKQITLLLSASFGRLILLSFLIAVVLAIYGIRWYLEQYAYRTNISPAIYLGAGLLAFTLAAFTIGYQCIKAAQANPVESLKHE